MLVLENRGLRIYFDDLIKFVRNEKIQCLVSIGNIETND